MTGWFHAVAGVEGGRGSRCVWFVGRERESKGQPVRQAWALEVAPCARRHDLVAAVEGGSGARCAWLRRARESRGQPVRQAWGFELAPSLWYGAEARR